MATTLEFLKLLWKKRSSLKPFWQTYFESPVIGPSQISTQAGPPRLYLRTSLNMAGPNHCNMPGETFDRAYVRYD